MSEKLDLIDRNELYNQIRLYLNRQSLGETTLTVGEIASIIADMPTTPVVRCEDCKYNKNHICTLNQCPVCGHPLYVKDTDSCSRGKQK